LQQSQKNRRTGELPQNFSGRDSHSVNPVARFRGRRFVPLRHWGRRWLGLFDREREQGCAVAPSSIHLRINHLWLPGVGRLCPGVDLHRSGHALHEPDVFGDKVEMDTLRRATPT